MKTEEAKGWGLRVGGSLPYLGYYFSRKKSDIEAQVTEPYHRVVEVVLVTKREWLRMRKLAQAFGG